MTSMTDTPTTASTVTDTVIAGVDTHGETHHAAVLDERGRELADREFAATPSGYAALLSWLRGHGHIQRVGVEGTGTYGAGLQRYLRVNGVVVVEVDRPDRRARRPGASPTHSTPTQPPARRSTARPAQSPRRATAAWRRSGHCAWLAAAPSRPGPKRSTSSRPCSSAPPATCASPCAACAPLSSSTPARDCAPAVTRRRSGSDQARPAASGPTLPDAHPGDHRRRPRPQGPRGSRRTRTPGADRGRRRERSAGITESEWSDELP
jgi:Transposase